MKKSLLTAGLLAAVVLSATACQKKAEEVVEAGSEIAVITSEVVVETSEAVSEVAEATDGDYTEEFASMVDALDSGKYYAFAEISGVHALLVAESTFDYGEGITAGSSAYIYVNNDEGMPVLSGDVQCGGTAYAICVLDGKLIYGNRAEVNRASIGEDLALVVEEGAQDDYEEATVVSFISK
jgi:hypothetical protein